MIGPHGRDGLDILSSLLNAMGPETDKMIFSLFTFDNEEGRTDFDVVVSLFDQHFLPKINIHEISQFFRHK